jgi:monoterpene epsilon-lactone hydrolase
MAQNEIDAVRALLSSKPRPIGWHERRSRIEEVGSVWPVASDIQRERVDIGGLAGEWSMAPGSDASRVLLYFHGGGYCSGSIVSHRRLVIGAGRAAKARTLAIEYRLAPEHPFPTALDDALSVWHFLERQGIAAKHIGLGGDSAGGGLAVVLANRLRDLGRQTPGCAWLISPWTDLTLSASTLETKDDVDPIIHKAYLAELAEAYLPSGIQRNDPRVSPLFADLKGLPPTLI